MASAELIKRHPDVNPFLLHKWERLFNVFFDHGSGAGQVKWQDFYVVLKHVRDIYGAESAQMDMAKKALKSLWEGLLGIADVNHDKVITIDEWVGMLKKCDPKTEPKWFNEYLVYMFKLFDVSEDSKLDLAEYTDGMVVYNFEESVAHEAFKTFAVDDKGKPKATIDIKEWKKYWLEYFYSTDKKSIGNNLFGVV